MTEEDQAFFGRCTSELRAASHDLGPEWSLELFGSAANGFGTRHSDIDATLVEDVPLTDKAAAVQPSAAFLRERVVPLFKEHPKFAIVEEVLGANIPILKLRFEDRLEVDLSCRNLDALQNTRLLRGYASLDDRVRDLGILIKLWARAAGVWGAARNHLSSYTFTLLAVYFMQVHPDVQLPYLPTGAFEADGDGQDKVDAARSLWKCSLSVGDLLRRFFIFFHTDFHWGSEVVSVRLGKRMWSDSHVFQSLRGRWLGRLHVEDPYKLERNLHCVLGQNYQEAKLRLAFRDACSRLQSGVPVGLDGSLLSTPGAAVALSTTPTAQSLDTPKSRDASERTELQGSPDELDDVMAVRPSCRAVRPFLSDSPDSRASTACGRSRRDESSGGECLSSEDEKKDVGTNVKKTDVLQGTERAIKQPFMWSDSLKEQPDEEEEAEQEKAEKKATWEWWRHLGAPQPADDESNDAKHPKLQWHHVEDLEQKFGCGTIEPTPGRAIGLSFVSGVSKSIAERISELCSEANGTNGSSAPDVAPATAPVAFQ